MIIYEILCYLIHYNDKGENMSSTAPVDLLDLTVKDDYNIFIIKEFGVCASKDVNENILKKLFFMSTFAEISQWVEKFSKSKKFIANPSSANNIDREVCLAAIHKLIYKAIKGLNDRKNGRDLKLLYASKIGDYNLIAAILSSIARTYWLDHGFMSNSKN